LGCPKCKRNSAEFLVNQKKNYPQIKRICWDLLTLIKSYNRTVTHQVYYTYTSSFRKDRSRVDWLSFLETKPKGRVEVVQDENEDISVIDEVFQVSELVEPYRVALSIDLEENLNFHVFNDSLVDVDAEELNVVLSSSGLANVNEDDDKHIKECDGADNNSIDDEDENSD
jgi:hypothetical protein